jgi:hypothetical protein
LGWGSALSGNTDPHPKNAVAALQRFSTLLRSAPRPHAAATDPAQGGGDDTARSCGTCAETNCFRHEDLPKATVGRRAFLVDENWPELRAYVAQQKAERDVLALPLDGARCRLARYRWETGGFARVTAATLTALTQSLALRRAADGPARRAAELRRARVLARRLARALMPDVTDVVVAQSLLPHLWRDGHLGGRRFTVLMTRMPMDAIEARLNAAAQGHPERRTLADFRADPTLVAAEREALAAADVIVTPHTQIAALFGERAVVLEWEKPKTRAAIAPVPGRVAFPGPTIARKGAYEVRAAARALNLEVVPVGSELEGAAFWNGARTHRTDGDWLDGVAAVVQPALLEDAPRKLLQALSRDVPVIATAACGLPEQDGLMLIPENDGNALIAALRRVISA